MGRRLRPPRTRITRARAAHLPAAASRRSRRRWRPPEPSRSMLLGSNSWPDHTSSSTCRSKGTSSKCNRIGTSSRSTTSGSGTDRCNRFRQRRPCRTSGGTIRLVSRKHRSASADTGEPASCPRPAVSAAADRVEWASLVTAGWLVIGCRAFSGFVKCEPESFPPIRDCAVPG